MTYKMKNGVRFKNYYTVTTETVNKGISGKCWMKGPSELQLIRVIPSSDYKSLYIYQEFIPLVEEFLEG